MVESLWGEYSPMGGLVDSGYRCSSSKPLATSHVMRKWPGTSCRRSNWHCSKRKHVRANFGVRMPMDDLATRPMQAMGYLLWDWFDGGLDEGW